MKIIIRMSEHNNNRELAKFSDVLNRGFNDKSNSV